MSMTEFHLGNNEMIRYFLLNDKKLLVNPLDVLPIFHKSGIAIISLDNVDIYGLGNFQMFKPFKNISFENQFSLQCVTILCDVVSSTKFQLCQFRRNITFTMCSYCIRVLLDVKWIACSSEPCLPKILFKVILIDRAIKDDIPLPQILIIILMMVKMMARMMIEMI